MTRLLFILVISILGVSCNASNSRVGETRPLLSERPITQIVASLYVVNIQPIMDTGDENQFTFEGSVTITVRAHEPDVTQIMLHSYELTFTSSDIEVRHAVSNELVPLTQDSLVIDIDSEIARFTLSSALQVGVDYVIRIEYRGTIRTDSTGLFRSEYLENGVTKYLAATQLEPTYARRVFPCLDDPAMKARFTFNIDRPEYYDVVLANTVFEAPSETTRQLTSTPTPPMSPFLVAFVICNFERPQHFVDDDHNELSFWTRSDFQDQTLFAFELSQKLLKGLKEHLGMNYYATEEIHKLDLVSFPDPAIGATHNWGLIKSREAFILYHPEETNALYKEGIAETVSRGLCQMFFGNLVTAEWWNDAWVNYGLASYLGNYMLSIVEPTLDASRTLITGTIHGGILNAMALDQIGQFSALVNGVHFPWDTSDSSRVISIYKSVAVVRMVHHLIGDNAFKFGVSRYLTQNQYNVASALDFYEAMQAGASGYNTLAEYPGTTVSNAVSPWITNAGYPLLRVQVNRATKSITLSQNRFYENTQTSSELYAIPITYSTGSNPNFNDTKPKFILNTRTHTFTENDLGEDDFVIFNNQFIGYMRVLYDNETWVKIANILQNENRTQIHVLNRARIVDDVFELMIAQLLDLSIGFDVLDFLEEETSYHVWATATFGISRLRNTMQMNDTNRQLFENRALNWMSLTIEELGFSEEDDDDHTTQKHRSLIANLACQLGHADCLNNATAYLNKFIDNLQSVPTNLRSFAFCYGLQQGDGAAYDFLSEYNNKSLVPSEYLTHQLNIACTGISTRVERYLNQVVFSGSVKREDMTLALLAPLRNRANIPTTFNFVREHFEALEARIGAMDDVIAGMIYQLYDEIALNSALAWIRSCAVCSDSVKASTESAIERRRLSFVWSETNAEKLTAILSDLPSSARALMTASSPPFVAVITLIMYRSN